MTDSSFAFIFGCGRSGTTILRRILASSDDTVALPAESGYFRSFFGRYGDLGSDRNFDAFFRDFTNRIFFEQLGLDGQALRIAVRERGTRDYGSFFQVCAQLYAEQQRADAPRYVVEKTPTHTRYAGKMLETYPDAKLIGIVRHPLDTVASLQLTGLTRLGLLPVPRSARVRAAAWQWSDEFELLERLQHTLPAERFHLVRYEDLVLNQTEVTERLSEFLGVTLSPDFRLRTTALGRHHTALSRKEQSIAAGELSPEAQSKYGLAKLADGGPGSGTGRALTRLLYEVEHWVAFKVKPKYKRPLKAVKRYRRHIRARRA